MSGRAGWTIGLVSMVIAAGVVHPFNVVASDSSRKDIGTRIGHGGSTYESKFLQASDCRVVGEERIGHGGTIYSPSQITSN